MTLFANVVRRWDIDPHVRASLPFFEAIALVNLKRVELTCLLVVLSDVLELSSGHRQVALFVEFPCVLTVLALGWALPRPRNVRVQRLAAVAFIVVGLLITQWATFELATDGRIGRGYITRVLAMTLLFVLPPRTLAAVLVCLFASYCATVAFIAASLGARLEAVLSAFTITAISQVTGWLIHDARRSDHDQRALIEAQNVQLEAQNAELDQLMAITAHDLRSPLYGLRNLFDLASRRAAQEPSLPARVLQDGIASLDAMLVLVTRLLQAHQAEHGPLAAVVHGDLREHVRAAAQRIAPLAQVQAVTLDVHLPEHALDARFDGGALAQILDNLLSNGVRHTPAGQALRLVARKVGGDALLAVEDGGPGVAPALRPALFGKFHRGPSESDTSGLGTGDKAGTGMGLFIAATYAARLGATLSYRPGTPRGAVFELAVPLVAD